VEITVMQPTMAKVSGDGDGERRALFGVGRRAEFVEQDERDCAVAVREMKSMLVTWAEKVDRFCSIDW
jgi:hypothetical protein